MSDFEKLGFEANVVGNAETILGNIVKHLESIQALSKKSMGLKPLGDSGNVSKKDTKKLSEIGKYQQRIAKQTELLEAGEYKQTRAVELLNQANQKSITNSILLENAKVRQANVEANLAQIKAQNAIQTDLLSNSEYQVALATQATNKYQQQQITNLARLRAEQEALNSGKYEELRRIELANQARKNTDHHLDTICLQHTSRLRQ